MIALIYPSELTAPSPISLNLHPLSPPLLPPLSLFLPNNNPVNPVFIMPFCLKLSCCPDQNSIQKPKHPERNLSIVPILKIVRSDICVKSGFDLRSCLVFSADLDGILPIDKKITRF